MAMMEAVRVNISYRPLRIAWAICAGDINAFRQAVRLSHALWGGRYNPIVVVDRKVEARRLVEVFRADLIISLGDSQSLKDFEESFSYLINPFYGPLFINEQNERAYSHALDVQNALVHLRDTPEWKMFKDAGVLVYDWKLDDPLSDVFLVQLGAYPDVAEIGIDYRSMVFEETGAMSRVIDPELPILDEIFERPTISSLSKFGIRPYRSADSGWRNPGFFSGDATNLDDLTCYWNLRAADISLCFIDDKYPQRFTRLIPAWEKMVREQMSSRGGAFEGRVAVWGRHEKKEDLGEPFGQLQLLHYSVAEDFWTGLKVQPPKMYFNEVSTLGVMGLDRGGKTKVSFALNDKPCSGDNYFGTQHLVASVSSDGLWGDELHTLRPMFIPELNEFYAKKMHIHYDKLRIEPEAVGLIIDTSDTDSFLYALPVPDMTEKIFDIAGLSVLLSSGGLMARQLIAHLGGLQGGRVLKIPGVRRLLKTHGLTDWFSKDDALGLIAGKDPKNPSAKFEDYKDLYIKRGCSANDPKSVFTYLVEKGLLRIGVELTCTSCSMTSWIALDLLKQRAVVCDLCGAEYDATSQLVTANWRYRRSGVFGRERNAQGSICVALTLQQLQANLSETFVRSMYSPSIELKAQDINQFSECEIDFVWFVARPFPQRTAVILGECKGQAPIRAIELKKDVDNMCRVAAALPVHRFETFILFAKLSKFNPEEIAILRTLNEERANRVILLTDRELEPFRIYERTKLEHKIDEFANTPQRFADNTAKVFFV
jgi:hypothetical protein